MTLVVRKRLLNSLACALSSVDKDKPAEPLSLGGYEPMDSLAVNHGIKVWVAVREVSGIKLLHVWVEEQGLKTTKNLTYEVQALQKDELLVDRLALEVVEQIERVM